jgi:hypothetical protein
MAIVKGGIQLTGSIKGVSFYTQAGSDKVIARTKGGATKQQIANSPKFAKLRLQQKEWSGCAKCASVIRGSFGGLHRLADYNLTPVLSGLVKNIQKCDTTHEIGQRSISLSLQRQALVGFNFNRNYPINGVLRVSPSWEINREKLLATVTIPRINTAIDLQNIQRQPYFRIIVALGSVSDMIYDAALNNYVPEVADLHGPSASTTGEWHSTQAVVPGHTLTVQMEEAQAALLTDEVSVVLSIGVEFGMVGFTGETVEVNHAGSGKVLDVR